MFYYCATNFLSAPKHLSFVTDAKVEKIKNLDSFTNYKRLEEALNKIGPNSTFLLRFGQEARMDTTIIRCSH